MAKRRNYGKIFPLTLEEIKRVVSKLKKNRKGCWIWEGTKRGAYGRIGLRGERWMAHRIAHQLFGGKVGEDEVVDHLCRNRPCCNPEHLEAVKDKTNVKRGEIARGAKHYKRKKKYCKFGHELAGENLAWETYKGRKRRVCKKCRRRRLQWSRLAKRTGQRVKALTDENVVVMEIEEYARWLAERGGGQRVQTEVRSLKSEGKRKPGSRGVRGGRRGKHGERA